MRSWALSLIWLAGLALAACQSGDSNRQTPTAATPTAAAVACPVAKDLCGFALELRQDMWVGNFEALEALTQKSSFTCPGPRAEGAGGPFPLCQGANPGEVRPGVAIHRLQSDGGTVETSILPALRISILDGGQGLKRGFNAPQVVGIQCPGTPSQPDCSRQAVIYFEGAAHFQVKSEPARWKASGLQFGNTTEDGSLPSTVSAMLFPDETLSAPGVYLPWRLGGEPLDSVRELWLFAPPPASALQTEPSEGPCPAEITLTIVPAPGTFPGGKEPIPAARVFPGVVGLDQGASARSGFVEVRPAGDLASGQLRLNIPEEACPGDLLTIVLAGDTWRVTGYRVK